MRFPISLYTSMTSYFLKNKLSGNDRFPLVLMLEPTHRCNLTCSGCGRIREYHDTLQQEMTLEECLQAVEESDPPVVTVTGGEPLLYNPVHHLVRELLARKKHIYFCTNGILLEESLSKFEPPSALHLERAFRRNGTRSRQDHSAGGRLPKGWPGSGQPRSWDFE